MDWKKHWLEAATLVGAAVICSLVANAFASNERKVALVGTYPNALKVTQQEEPAEAATPEAPVTTSQVPAAAPATQAPPAATQTVNGITREEAASRTAPVAKPVPAAAKPAAAAPAAAQPPAEETLAKFKPHPDKPWVEIHHGDVAALYAKGVLFLDARRTSVYEEGHIAGARSFSVWEADIDQKVNKLYEERSDPREQNLPIVVYCSGGDCEDSHMLAQKLWGLQFNNVYVYKDGFPDWQKHGGAVRRGPSP